VVGWQRVALGGTGGLREEDRFGIDGGARGRDVRLGGGGQRIVRGHGRAAPATPAKSKYLTPQENG
jgi:hypothetical protein